MKFSTILRSLFLVSLLLSLIYLVILLLNLNTQLEIENAVSLPDSACSSDVDIDDCLLNLPLIIKSDNTKPAPKDISNVLIVGDSISAPDSFALKDYEYEKLSSNGKASGFYINEIIYKEFNYFRKIQNKHFDIVFLSIGSNDALENGDLTDSSIYNLVYSNLEIYINEAFENNSYPVLSTIAFAKIMPDPWLHKGNIVNQAILRLGYKYNIPIFNYYKLAKEMDDEFVFKDSVHATDAFNKVRSEAFNSELKNL